MAKDAVAGLSPPAATEPREPSARAERSASADDPSGICRSMLSFPDSRSFLNCATLRSGGVTDSEIDAEGCAASPV